MDVNHQHRPVPPAIRLPDILHRHLLKRLCRLVCRKHSEDLNRDLLEITVYVSGARVRQKRDCENV